MQVLVARQCVRNAKFSFYDLLYPHPTTSVCIDDTCLAHDTLGEAVFPESLDLLAQALRELRRVATRGHAVQQLFLKALDVAVTLPGRHRAPQPIRLARCEARSLDGKLHDLLLEDRHAECALEHLLHLWARIVDGLLAFAATQVRMHHVALDGTGPHDRNFDDEIVEAFGLQTRQHGHLRARFDLEHPDGVGTRHHRVHLWILGRQMT